MIFASTASLASMRSKGVCWHLVKPPWGHCKSSLIVFPFERTHSATWQIYHTPFKRRIAYSYRMHLLPSASRGAYWVFQALAANRFVIHLLRCKNMRISASWTSKLRTRKYTALLQVESTGRVLAQFRAWVLSFNSLSFKVNNFLERDTTKRNRPRSKNLIERNIDDSHAEIFLRGR